MKAYFIKRELTNVLECKKKNPNEYMYIPQTPIIEIPITNEHNYKMPKKNKKQVKTSDAPNDTSKRNPDV